MPANKNKKLFFLAFSLLLFAAPFLNFARADACSDLRAKFQTQGSGLTGQDQGNVIAALPSYCNGNSLILTAINVLMGLAAVVAILFIIAGGFWFLTSAGNEEQAEKGRKTLINSIIGLIVIILAAVIVRIVVNALSGNTGTTGSSNNSAATNPNAAQNGGGGANPPASGSLSDVQRAANLQNVLTIDDLPNPLPTTSFTLRASFTGAANNPNSGLSQVLQNCQVQSASVVPFQLADQSGASLTSAARFSTSATYYEADLTINPSSLPGQSGVVVAQVCGLPVKNLPYQK